MKVSSSVLFLTIASVGAVVAAPGPGDKKADLPFYFPTQEGAQRVYSIQVGDAKNEVTDTVTKVERKDGGYRVTTVLKGGSATESVTEVTAGGVFRVSTAGRALPKPQPLLKLPAKAGDHWEDRPAGASLVFTFTVGKEEEVVVPAGKFKAIPVEMKTEFGGRTRATTTWYAPGVGAVKSTSVGGPAERTQVLKSFTPGKK